MAKGNYWFQIDAPHYIFSHRVLVLGPFATQQSIRQSALYLDTSARFIKE